MVELVSLQELVRSRRQVPLSDSTLPSHLGHFSDALCANPPRRTTSVFALPFSHGNATADWAEIVAFGRYRFAFSLIEELAKVLAPEVVRTGVVPSILPVRVSALAAMTWSNPLVKTLAMDGVHLYPRDPGNGG